MEMHSLIRFIPSASLLGGGRDIYKKEYYYACVQKWDLGTLTVHVYMLNQLLYSLKHMAVAPNSFLCHSAVHQLRVISDLAPWILVGTSIPGVIKEFYP